MEIIFTILTSILIIPAIFIILPWIYGHSKKEEAENAIIDKTKYPHRFTVFSVAALIITVIFFMVVAVLIVFEKDETTHMWIGFILSAVFIISLPSLLVLLALRTYEVIRTDGILVVRPFKKKFVKYSEMASYHYSFNQLTVFDNKHKAIFGVYDNRVGMNILLNQLDYRGVFRE